MTGRPVDLATITQISVHEHIGAETLEYPNGVRVPYRQSVPELARHLCDLPWEQHGVSVRGIAAVCLPMPCYVNFRSTPVHDVPEIYAQRNSEVLTACAAWPPNAVAESVGATRALPVHVWPALIVTSHESAAEAERRYDAALDQVIAMKWHPAAEARSPFDFMKAGYLDLAVERNMPLVVHCARQGTPGDLADLLDGFVPAAVAKRARVAIAHAGFLHPRLSELGGLPGVFTDCGPWEAICSSTVPELVQAQRVERLARAMVALRRQMCLGFDTPWHVQYWDNGQQHGRSVTHDFAEMTEAASVAELGLEDFFSSNARRFLFGP